MLSLALTTQKTSLPHVSRALKVFIIPGTEESGQYAAVPRHMDHLSATSPNTDVKQRAKHVAKRMREIKFAVFCHFVADLFGVISKLRLKMQRNDLILPVAVSLLQETVASVESLKSSNISGGHLERFLQMLQESPDVDEMLFQEITLKGSLEGTIADHSCRESSETNR